MGSDCQPPNCVFVTGPRGAGKTRWMQQCILRLLEQRPATKCAVLLAEEGRTRMEGFIEGRAGLIFRKLFLPCLCCSCRSAVAGALRQLSDANTLEWIFVELPAVAAAGMISELDRTVGAGTFLVVCLNEAWAKARRDNEMMPFQSSLLAVASAVVAGSGDVDRVINRLAAGEVSCPTQ